MPKKRRILFIFENIYETLRTHLFRNLLTKLENKRLYDMENIIQMNTLQVQSEQSASKNNYFYLSYTKTSEVVLQDKQLAVFWVTVGIAENKILDFFHTGLLYKDALLFFSKVKNSKEWHLDVYRYDKNPKVVKRTQTDKPIFKYHANYGQIKAEIEDKNYKEVLLQYLKDYMKTFG